jgi:hypothetical protein
MNLKESINSSRKESVEISNLPADLRQAFAKLSQAKVLEPWPNSYYRERKELLQSQMVEIVKRQRAK